MQSYARVVLNGTKRLLLKNGWCQGRTVNVDMNYCIIGAMEETCYILNMFNFDQSLLSLRKVESKMLEYVADRDKYLYLHEWNDEKDRTFEDVINLIDKVLLEEFTEKEHEEEVVEVVEKVERSEDNILVGV